MLASLFLIQSSSKLLVTRTGIKARLTSILGWIRPIILELLALEWRKFHTFELEYLWSQSTYLDQILCVASLGWGKRLHKVWEQIGSKLWFPWQQKAPVDLKLGKWCLHLFLVVFDTVLLILAGNEDMHKILDEFEFRSDRTTDYGVSCPWVSKKFPIDL